MHRSSGITDYYVIVSGSSGPHLKAMYNEVEQQLKGEGVLPYRRSGDPFSGWLVLDYVDVILHILSREKREYYAIEELWDNAPRVR